MTVWNAWCNDKDSDRSLCQFHFLCYKSHVDHPWQSKVSYWLNWGMDICHLTECTMCTQVCSTVLAESLVSELQEADLQELSRSEAVRRQYEVETERLTSRLEHTRAQNAVLALTLDESKTHCDRLSLLVGKYESSAIALRWVVTRTTTMDHVRVAAGVNRLSCLCTGTMCISSILSFP